VGAAAVRWLRIGARLGRGEQRRRRQQLVHVPVLGGLRHAVAAAAGVEGLDKGCRAVDRLLLSRSCVSRRAGLRAQRTRACAFRCGALPCCVVLRQLSSCCSSVNHHLSRGINLWPLTPLLGGGAPLLSPLPPPRPLQMLRSRSGHGCNSHLLLSPCGSCVPAVRRAGLGFVLRPVG
jgi:hypothetical protein